MVKASKFARRRDELQATNLASSLFAILKIMCRSVSFSKYTLSTYRLFYSPDLRRLSVMLLIYVRLMRNIRCEVNASRIIISDSICLQMADCCQTFFRHRCHAPSHRGRGMRECKPVTPSSHFDCLNYS